MKLLLKLKKMKTYNYQLNNLKADYNYAKPFMNGHLAPRRGFYLIKEINTTSIGATNDVPVAKALWSKDGRAFLEEGIFEIQLLSLFQPSSIGDTFLGYNQLLNCVIQIHKGQTDVIENDTQSIISYWVQWSVVHINIPIISIDSAKQVTPENNTPKHVNFLSMLENFDSLENLLEANFESLDQNSLNAIQNATYDEGEQSSFDENPLTDE